MQGRLRLGLILAGVLVLVAIALWPVSREQNIYKTEGGEWGGNYVPTGATRTVSCGAAVLALNKREGRCDEAARTRVLMAGIAGGVLIIGGVVLVPLLAPKRRRADAAFHI